MDLDYFPYDTQRCYIELNSRKRTKPFYEKIFTLLFLLDGHLLDEVLYQWIEQSNFGRTQFFQVEDFYLVHDTALNTFRRNYPKETYSRPAAVMRLYRKPVSLHLFLHLPVLLLVALSLLPAKLFGKGENSFSNRITFLGALLVSFLLLSTAFWCFKAPSSARLNLADQFLLLSLLLLVLAFVDALVQQSSATSASSASSSSEISYDIVEVQGKGRGYKRSTSLTTGAKCWHVFRTYALLPSAALIVYGAYAVWVCLVLSIRKTNLFNFF